MVETSLACISSEFNSHQGKQMFREYLFRLATWFGLFEKFQLGYCWLQNSEKERLHLSGKTKNPWQLCNACSTWPCYTVNQNLHFVSLLQFLNMDVFNIVSYLFSYSFGWKCLASPGCAEGKTVFEPPYLCIWKHG